MSDGRMQQEETRLAAEIEAPRGAAETLDTAEDAQFGKDLRADEVPAAPQQRESLRAAILLRTDRGGCKQLIDCDRGDLLPSQGPGPVAAAAGCRANPLWPHP